MIKAIADLAARSYIGSILQCIRIYANPAIPTAGVGFDPKIRSLVLHYNPQWFASLNELERQAVLTHEMEHILRRHIHTPGGVTTRKNIAMDMAINQRIDNLPAGCVDYKQYKDKDGKDFLPGLPWEGYYEALDGAKGPEGQGDGAGDHSKWGEAEQEAASDLMKRAQYAYEKRTGGKSKELNEALELNEASVKDINYKRLIEAAIMRHTPGSGSKTSWSRPSRRFGLVAPGRKPRPSPTVAMYWDTSGSMTLDEINDSVGINTGILRAGVKKTTVSLFNSSLYFTKEFKKGMKFNSGDVQSGGTDLTEVLEHIKKTSPDVAVITTDGHYSDVAISGLTSKIVFVIKKGGNINHPLKRFGETVVYGA